MNDRGRGVSRSVSSMFIYLLIGMFALLSLLLVMIGAGAYQSIVRDGQRAAQLRTSLGYVVSKVRAADESGAISVENAEGRPVLCLRQRFDDEAYITRIYSLPAGEDQEPGLYELFSMADEQAELINGQYIAPIAAFDARTTGGGIQLSVTTPGGDMQQMFLRLRSAR